MDKRRIRRESPIQGRSDIQDPTDKAVSSLATGAGISLGVFFVVGMIVLAFLVWMILICAGGSYLIQKRLERGILELKYDYELKEKEIDLELKKIEKEQEDDKKKR